VIEKSFSFTSESDTQLRLDKFLVKKFPEYSRSRLQKLIKNGNVLINGGLAKKTGQILESGMVIDVTIPPPETPDLIPEPIHLNVIFENEDLFVIDKPAGMVVHPSAGHMQGTLVHAALAHAPEIEGVGGIKRPGIVHRLDKATSGIILLAKNDRTHLWLQNQFRDRQVTKTYVALVDGAPPTPTGKIDAAIGRDTSQRKRMAVTTPHKGREAVTKYRTLESFDHYTLLEVQPETGRTHQIRVHLSFLDCPVAGDTVYGRRHSTISIPRHFLHAIKLGIVIPGEASPRFFETPLPDALEKLLNGLRRV